MSVRHVVFAYKDSNPYQDLLKASLSPYGYEVAFSNRMPWFPFDKNGNRLSIVHMHWPSRLYKKKWKTPFKSLVFLCKFFLLRASGVKFVWTCHNLIPHENSWRSYDLFFRKFLIRNVHGIIFHCQWALGQLTDFFHCSPQNSCVIPHGNYIARYPASIDTQDARDKLHIPQDKKVLLSFGNLKDYKGLDRLLVGFNDFVAVDSRAFLLIAGRGGSTLEHEISRVCSPEAKKNIKLVREFISDKDVNIYFSAADIFVAPFDNITTSGSVILGLSFGLPVVAPAIGCLPDLFEGTDAAVLYSSSKANGFSDALRQIADEKIDLLKISAAAAALAKRLDWDGVGRQTASFYDELCSQ
jgi:glycosyltransferase involved in cell wall biosynthesis